MPGLMELLNERSWLLADGATGTNYFDRGLLSGDPPEMWNIDHPERVAALHTEFIEAGADIILTNTFGCNRRRLMLHKLHERTGELNRAAVAIARGTAETAARPVVVAGSVGPTGDLMVPLGELEYDQAVEVFREQMAALAEAGADVIWIETMSAPEEIRAAVEAATGLGLAYVYTASFDTAGRTMMGLEPKALAEVVDAVPEAPLAIGANCGVGASDLLVSVLAMTEARAEQVIIAKANCGIPEIQGDQVVYTGTPSLMSRFACLAIDAGVRIVGGCCGTTADHLAAMRSALETHTPGPRPTREQIVAEIGPLAAPPVEGSAGGGRRRSRRARG